MKSKVTIISNRQTTVRTVIPKGVVELLDLGIGDYIEWKPEVENNQIVFKVTKGEEK